jgi:serine/threonine-protein kinase
MQRPPEAVAAHPGPLPHLSARRRSRRLFTVWVAVVVTLAVLVATVAWWLGTGRWTAMPAVLGLPETTAQQLLSDADLVVTTTKGGDGQAAAGVVLASDQPPGAQLLRGSRVTLTVSSGRPTVPVIPAGTPRDKAEDLIRAAGLDPDVDRDDAEYSESADEGTVIRTDPTAGTELSRGTSVRLVLSRGSDSDQVEMPSVIGEDFDDARDELRELGLRVDRAHQSPLGERFGDRFGNGVSDRVLQQSHGPGSMVDRDTTITLTTF